MDLCDGNQQDGKPDGRQRLSDDGNLQGHCDIEFETEKPGLLSQDIASKLSHDISVDMTNWDELSTNGSFLKLRTVIARLSVESRTPLARLTQPEPTASSRLLEEEYNLEETVEDTREEIGQEDQPSLGLPPPNPYRKGRPEDAKTELNQGHGGSQGESSGRSQSKTPTDERRASHSDPKLTWAESPALCAQHQPATLDDFYELDSHLGTPTNEDKPLLSFLSQTHFADGQSPTNSQSRLDDSSPEASSDGLSPFSLDDIDPDELETVY